MPHELKECVKKVKAEGHSEGAAYGICCKSTGWRKAKGGGWKNEKTGETFEESTATPSFDTFLEDLMQGMSQHQDLEQEAHQELVKLGSIQDKKQFIREVEDLKARDHALYDKVVGMTTMTEDPLKEWYAKLKRRAVRHRNKYIQ